MDAVLVGRVVAGGLVVGAAVVPDDDVADPPFVAVFAVRLDHRGGQFVDQRITFGRFGALNEQDFAWIKIQ